MFSATIFKIIIVPAGGHQFADCATLILPVLHSLNPRRRSSLSRFGQFLYISIMVRVNHFSFWVKMTDNGLPGHVGHVLRVLGNSIKQVQHAENHPQLSGTSQSNVRLPRAPNLPQ
jgi:hypothetical protein